MIFLLQQGSAGEWIALRTDRDPWEGKGCETHTEALRWIETRIQVAESEALEAVQDREQDNE